MFKDFSLLYVADMEKSNVQKLFGLRVKSLRNERGYSQEQLAERAHLHWTYVSSIERGERNVSLYTVVVIAQALGCDTQDLVP